MEVRCKKCGRPLRDPESIARGMGPACAGIATSGKGFSSSRYIHSGSAHPLVGENHASIKNFSFGEEHRKRVPEALENFPSDLLDLVLSAPAVGSIAARVKSYSHREKVKEVDPARLLKQIRRMCIECRLPFWPGLSMNLEPIPCIPCGDNGWKIGNNGRVISKDELVAYLSRYGIISQEQMRTTV